MEDHQMKLLLEEVYSGTVLQLKASYTFGLHKRNGHDFFNLDESYALFDLKKCSLFGKG